VRLWIVAAKGEERWQGVRHIPDRTGFYNKDLHGSDQEASGNE
jgi:hypothetical protein